MVGWEGGQGGQGGQVGLAHAQRRRHGVADLQRLVERQPAQAVGVEVVWWEERLGTQQRRLRRREEGSLQQKCAFK